MVVNKNSKVVTINNFNQFVGEINELLRNEDTTRYIFRGEKAYCNDDEQHSKITPSVFRSRVDGTKYNESQLIDAVLSRFPDNFRNAKSNMDVLLTMQHYRVPTRLLDITFNPYIALFFATSEPSEKFKKHFVYVIDTKKIQEYNQKVTDSIHSDVIRMAFDSTVAITAAIARLTAEDQKELGELRRYYANMAGALKNLSLCFESKQPIKDLQAIFTNCLEGKILDIKEKQGNKNNALKEDLLNFTTMKQIYHLCKNSNLSYKSDFKAENVKDFDSHKITYDALLAKIWDVMAHEMVINKLLDSIKYYYPGFSGRIDFKQLEQYYIVMPHYSNPRIINQKGGFLLLSPFAETKHVPADFISKVFEFDFTNNDTIKDYQQQLRYMNIDQNFIYPELENFIHTDYLQRGG